MVSLVNMSFNSWFWTSILGNPQPRRPTGIFRLKYSHHPQGSHRPTRFRQLAFPTSYILIIFSLAGWKGLVQKGPGTRNSWGWLQSHPIMVYKKGVGLWHWLYYICITYRWNPKYATVESSWVTRSHCGSSWRCFPFWNLHFDHFGGIQYTV